MERVPELSCTQPLVALIWAPSLFVESEMVSAVFSTTIALPEPEYVIALPLRSRRMLPLSVIFRRSVLVISLNKMTVEPEYAASTASSNVR